MAPKPTMPRKVPKNVPKKPKRARETERKFGVDSDYELPDLTDLVTVRDDGTDALAAAIYDTDDLRLVREGVVLRRRTGGADAGWHLKLPVSGKSERKVPVDTRVREEIQLPLSGSGSRPPAELTGLVHAYLGRERLGVRARIRTERSRLTLLHPDDAAAELAEVADDSVAILNGRTVVERFREIEVEDRAGAPDAQDLLDAVVSRIRRSGAEPATAPSKAARALGDRAAEPPPVPPPGPLDGSAPARTAIQGHLATYVRALRQEDVRVRLDAYDSVHQLRVATRRLRSGLRIFRPLLDRDWSEPLRAELKWLAGSFGAARDTEVLLARLETHAGALPDPEAVEAVRSFLRRRLGQEMAEARDAGLAALDSARCVDLYEELVAAAQNPATGEAAGQPSDQALPPLVRRAWDRLATAVGRLHADDPDEVWHAARITAKRARYAAEACTPALGSPAKALAKELSRVTDALGEHQDAVVAAETLTRLATSGRVPARTAYWLGVLHEHERTAAAVARSAFGDVWANASRPKLRRWLDQGV